MLFGLPAPGFLGAQASVFFFRSRIFGKALGILASRESGTPKKKAAPWDVTWTLAWGGGRWDQRDMGWFGVN